MAHSKKFWRRVFSWVSILSILLNSVLPYGLVATAYAQEATASATQQVADPTPTETPSPTPTDTPIPTQTDTPTPTPTLEPTPTATPSEEFSEGVLGETTNVSSEETYIPTTPKEGQEGQVLGVQPNFDWKKWLGWGVLFILPTVFIIVFLKKRDQ